MGAAPNIAQSAGGTTEQPIYHSIVPPAQQAAQGTIVHNPGAQPVMGQPVTQNTYSYNSNFNSNYPTYAYPNPYQSR